MPRLRPLSRTDSRRCARSAVLIRVSKERDGMMSPETAARRDRRLRRDRGADTW
jgi:hypothetical protein